MTAVFVQIRRSPAAVPSGPEAPGRGVFAMLSQPLACPTASTRQPVNVKRACQPCQTLKKARPQPFLVAGRVEEKNAWGKGSLRLR